MRQRRAYRQAGGFTLIEMMVVIAILGVLTAVLLPNVTKVIEKSRLARTAAELQSIAAAMEAYLADVGSYPPAVGEGSIGGGWGADRGLASRSSVTSAHLASWNGPYLKEWPIKTAWGGIVGCSAEGAYYLHPPIGWIDRDGIAGNDVWIHMNPYCVRYPTAAAMQLDQLMDDGNPSTGRMRLTGGVPEYIYYYVGEGTRSW